LIVPDAGHLDPVELVMSSQVGIRLRLTNRYISGLWDLALANSRSLERSLPARGG